MLKTYPTIMKCAAVFGVALALTAGVLAAEEKKKSEDTPQANAGAVILDGKDSFFRWMSVQRPAVIAAEGGAAELATIDGKKIDAKAAGQVTPELPAGWTDAALDDSLWPRTTIERMANLAFLTGDPEPRGLAGRNPADALYKVGVLALRGKFNVTDPAAAQLKLSLKYRGGVVVYLNGQEVARGGLPTGALTPGTPGEPYPAEAYVDAKGKPLPELSRVKKDDKETTDRIAKRDRVLGPVALPAKALRNGVNVLAIELHRSDYHPSAVKYYVVSDHGVQEATGWTPYGLMDLSLSASGGGVESNAHRPAGVQIWKQDCNDRTSVSDYGDPNEPLRPIVLTGARNGVFGGKLVVSSDQPIDGLKAAAGELKGAGGKGVIAASAGEVLYAEPAMFDNWHSKWIEPLSATAPAKVAPAAKGGGGAVEEVWVWVRVPADAPSGDYAGTLAVSAGGKKLADVPVQLHVADWKLPEPRDFHTFVGIYQSPTTLAVQYNVPEWSDKHWELMDRSMSLLGQLGNQLVHVTVVDKTKLGNEDGMVTWIKKPDGTFDYDYLVVERYLKMVHKYMGVPKFVVLHIYNAGGWSLSGPKHENTVTVLDPKTGQREHLQVPEFGTEESKKFWTPVLTGLKERLAKEGMEKSLCLGNVCDATMTPPEAKMFADILGNDVQWFRQGHPGHGSLTTAEPMPGGGQVGLHFFTYLPSLPNPETTVPTIHKAYWPRAAYFRTACSPDASLLIHRSFAATSRFLQLPGFGYMGLDFWTIAGINKNKGDSWVDCLWGRWPRASGYPGQLSPQYLTWPGPDGAEPMVSFQAMREGIQETEALYVISEALEKSSDKLGAELAGRCQQALKDELTFYKGRAMVKYQHSYYQVNHYGWQELSQRVFTLAGEVAARTAAK